MDVRKIMLWIAFIYRIFALWKQHSIATRLCRCCCELLSFIVSLLFENSKTGTDNASAFVVNCFHLSYLCSLKTALISQALSTTWLWIAFIYRIFALWKQQKQRGKTATDSCELLSFIVSLLFENSTMEPPAHFNLLWIAFIYRIFALWKQPDTE